MFVNLSNDLSNFCLFFFQKPLKACREFPDGVAAVDAEVTTDGHCNTICIVFQQRHKYPSSGTSMKTFSDIIFEYKPNFPLMNKDPSEKVDGFPNELQPELVTDDPECGNCLFLLDERVHAYYLEA